MYRTQGPGTGLAPAVSPNPPTMAPTSAPNVMNQAAGAYTSALNQTRSAFGFTPSFVTAGQLGQTNMGQYMNPYTQQVINAATADMNRGRQMALNQIGADATAAGAFGGSRHGVAEAQTNQGFAQELGQMTAGLRQDAFNNAQNMAQFDINNRLNAGMFNANQRDENIDRRLGAANQMSGLAGQGFGFGQSINNNLMQQGSMQQALMQQLIDASRGQFQGFTGAPANGLNLINGMIPQNGGQTTSSTSNPGLLGILGALL